MMFFVVCKVGRKALDEVCHSIQVQLAGEGLALGVGSLGFLE